VQKQFHLIQIQSHRIVVECETYRTLPDNVLLNGNLNQIFDIQFVTFHGNQLFKAFQISHILIRNLSLLSDSERHLTFQSSLRDLIVHGNTPKHCYDQQILPAGFRSEEHTSELQSRENLVCRLLLEKKKNNKT